MGAALEFEHDSALWRYALELYDRPGVSEWLLGLQNRLGLEVNFVLLACWCAEQGMEVTVADWQELARDTAELRLTIIAPLRRQRVDLGRSVSRLFRDRLLLAELTAENLMYISLWHWWKDVAEARAVASPSRDRSRALCRRNLESLASFHAVTEFADMQRLLHYIPLTVA